ncbi:MAG TPA: hypothetical protein VIK62_00210 [Verrucomicrobiae bacterium]
MQDVLCAFVFADESAGNKSAARIAMMAMTTSSSTSVNAKSFLSVFNLCFICG